MNNLLFALKCLGLYLLVFGIGFAIVSGALIIGSYFVQDSTGSVGLIGFALIVPAILLLIAWVVASIFISYHKSMKLHERMIERGKAVRHPRAVFAITVTTLLTLWIILGQILE